MRGLRSTVALVAVLSGLGAYIYFVTWKIEPDDAAKTVKVFEGLQSDAVIGLQIKSDKGPMTALEKSERGWQITAPSQEATDQMEAGSVATGLASVEKGRIIEENAPSLDQYGLASPRIDVAFKTMTDSTFRHLLIGDKTATGGDLFAKLDGSNQVFLIPAYQELTFNKGPFDLRDKTMLAFERDKVTSIDVVNGGASFTLAKNSGTTDWDVVEPQRYRADPSAVEGLRARLETAQMKTIIEPEATEAQIREYGLDKPSRSVVLHWDAKTLTLMLGHDAGDGGVYARESARPNFVVTVDPAMAEDVTKGAFEYRRKDLFDFRPFNATRITFTRANGSSLPFEKVTTEAKDGKAAEETWRRLGPNPVDAPKDKIGALLSRLSTMRALSFVETAANTGLDKPELTVEARFGDNRTERVMFGRIENDVYAARPNEPGAARVNDDEYAEAQKTLIDLAK
ncbi:MAG: DUF4340 domain-containing protein [Acidobacteria bacterium]|nr:DUF4340 domain-containing protein [Acidobacteriota bacterium]